MIPIHSNLWMVTSSCRARPLLLTAICPCLGLAMANGMDACNMVCTDYSCSLAIFSATRYTCTRLSHHYIRQSAFVWITISFPTKLSLRVLSCLQLSRLWTGLDIPGKYYNEGSLGSNVWLEAMKKEEAGGIESHSSVA